MLAKTESILASINVSYRVWKKVNDLASLMKVKLSLQRVKNKRYERAGRKKK